MSSTIEEKTETKSQLTETKSQLTETKNQLTETKNQLTLTKTPDDFISRLQNRKSPRYRHSVSSIDTNGEQTDSVIPKVIEQSSYYENQKAENLLNEDLNTRWNAGHISGWDVPNWVVFDFGKEIRVTEFALRQGGDYTHDTHNFELQTSYQAYGPWKTVASYVAQPNITTWQVFSIAGVSRYWRLYISTRYSRYQAYLTGVRFRTSTELGRFENLSNVEKEFLRQSKRRDVYPNEHIGVVEVANVAELGQLAALVFIEWIIENPTGVIGLPTGKTPELFIKWLRYYKTHWTNKEIQIQLQNYDIINKNNSAKLSKQFPDTSLLRFVQLDEFFPIESTQSNSFLKYIREYYQSTLDLKEENMLLIDFSKLNVFQKNSMKQIFPAGKADLSLLNRKPKNDLEILQLQALQEVEKYCEEYENKIREMGGYGFFLGGIGWDGHIAFNFRGSDFGSKTRLVTLNYETAAQSAGDFGGISNTRNMTAVTVGLSTISYNRDAKIIIMAAGELKANVVKDAIMLPKDPARPASVLHDLPGARFYLTQGSSLYLTDRRIEDIKIACEADLITQEQLYQCVCDLAISLNKQIIHLTAEDFLNSPQTNYIYRYWVSKRQPITKLTRAVRDYLEFMLERGTSLPAGARILHTAPHHDDVMLAYHEITPYLFRYNHNYFAYVTSGFNSVTDNYVVSIISRVNLDSQEDIKQYIEGVLKMKLDEILQKFKIGYQMGINSYMEEAETLLVLRRIRQVKEIDSVEKFITVLKELKGYFDKKKENLNVTKDEHPVQIIKGAIRESECDRMWAIQDIEPKTNVFHLRSAFYTGDFFNPMPTINEDCKPMLKLYNELQPSLVTVAFDPEGTGPDTHYKVLQVVAQSLRLARDEKKNGSNLAIWGYRNVWHRFNLCASSLAIPITAKAMHEMHKTFLCVFGCQREAEFPSPEYDGPFSVLSQRFHTTQLFELQTCLGKSYFTDHWNPAIKNADGIILIKEMNLDEFLRYAEDLRSRIEIHKQIN